MRHRNAGSEGMLGSDATVSDRAQTSRSRRRKTGGFSMIEVLVVIVLFSFALIGLVGLQARAVQTSVAGEDANRAALLANDLASRMWTANTLTLDPTVVTAWNGIINDATQRGLPNGIGTVTVAGRVATIVVTWRAPHEPSGTVHNYTTQVTM